MQIPLHNSRLECEECPDGIFRVKRRWEPIRGGLQWRSDLRSNRLWTINGFNKLAPLGPFNGRAFVRDRSGKNLFDPRAQSLTLEDFLFNWETCEFFHISTRLYFSTRQINEQFFVEEFWPRCNGALARPSIFLKRYSRLDSTFAVEMSLQGIDLWAESKRRIVA